MERASASASSQLLQCDHHSQQSCSSSSGIGSILALILAASSPSSDPRPLFSKSTCSSLGFGVAGEEEDADWSLACSRRAAGARRQACTSGGARSNRRGGADSTVVKKKVKNARKKERVKMVRQNYEELCAVVGARVERGSGHSHRYRVVRPYRTLPPRTFQPI
jgi:hypothetical protein